MLITCLKAVGCGQLHLLWHWEIACLGTGFRTASGEGKKIKLRARRSAAASWGATGCGEERGVRPSVPLRFIRLPYHHRTCVRVTRCSAATAWLSQPVRATQTACCLPLWLLVVLVFFLFHLTDFYFGTQQLRAEESSCSSAAVCREECWKAGQH